MEQSRERGNLIRRIISPNQDDLFYSFQIFFSGQQKLGKLPNTLSLAEQRRPVQTSHWRFFNSSSSMDTWGNLSNLWIPCVYHLDQGIPVEYELDTFNTPPHEQLYVTPEIGYVDAMPNPAPGTLLSFHLWATFMETHTPLPKSTWHTKLTVTPKFISSNGKQDFRLTMVNTIPRTSDDTRCFLNSIISPFRLFTHNLSYETCSKNTNYIFHAANKDYS